jgi:hypothetical protein
MRLVMIFSFADRLQSKMVEVGFRELLQLFLRLSKEGMGRTFDPDTLLASGESASCVAFMPAEAISSSIRYTDAFQLLRALVYSFAIDHTSLDSAGSAYADSKDIQHRHAHL